MVKGKFFFLLHFSAISSPLHPDLNFKPRENFLSLGIPTLDIPPLDPFKLEETLLEYHNGQIHAKFGIRDYSLYGLRDLQYQNVR